MLQRWQTTLEWLNVALLLFLPLHQLYYYGSLLPDSATALYLATAGALGASWWLKRYCAPLSAMTGFALLEQWLALALLLTLLYYAYLPLAPVTAAAAQWLWLACQLSVAGLLFRLYLAGKQQYRAGAPTAGATWLVSYASQSGMAQQLAQHSAQQLQHAGFTVWLTELDQLTYQQLSQCQKALFVVSTYGEGEPPDNARRFYQLAQQWQHNLHQLEYAVLALGDRSYQHFCAFGHWLQQWLHHRQATALQPLLELDSSQRHSPALSQWQQLLAGMTNQTANIEEPQWQLARLQSRYIANPASTGLPCYVVKLEPASGQRWQAGDIVEIQPQNSKCSVALWLTRHQLHGCQAVHYLGRQVPLCWALAELQLGQVQPPAAGEALPAWLDKQPRLPLRRYSIASIAEEGCFTLLVRQVQHADGSLGIGSGWLTAWASEQQPVQLRLRRRSQFYLPADNRPVIFIASGTGIAGIRALLAERVRRGQRQNWLIFGERRQQTDFFFARDIQLWQQQGFISHCDLAFSQDNGEKRYVQHLLAGQQQRLRQWLSQDAAIYVCGSQHGMGQAVQQTLNDAIDPAELDRLAQQGRYRRDLY